MKKYSSYKDSGVEWIGEIPNHWNRTRVKHLVNYVNGYSFKSNDFDREYDIPVLRIGDVGDEIDFDKCIKVKSNFLDEKSDFIVKKDDILIGLTGGTIGKSGRYKYDFPSLLNQRVGLLRNTNKVLNGLLYHYVKSEVFIRYIMFDCYGGGQDNIGMGDILNMVFSLPPLPEQQQIVSFLDDKTKKIDSLIQHKERKIELLKEKRTSLINHVVTKGLDPNVEMKESGVEWIGKIPSHWKDTKVKYQFSFRGGSTPSTEVPEYWNGDIPWVSSKDMKTKYLFDSVDHITQEGLSNSSCSLIEINSLIMVVRSGILQRTIPISINKVELVVNQDQKVLKSKGDVLVEFFYYFIKGNESFLLLEWMKEGTTVESIEMEYLSGFKLFIPNLNVQQQIVEYLDEQTEEIDTLIQLEQNKIELLKEYRQSLISEVVTGKIKVTNE